MAGNVFRCSNCGAPLEAVEAGVATCEFCAAENHIGLTGTEGGAAVFARAAREADRMVADNQARLEALQEEFEQRMGQAIETGSEEVGRQALHAFESYLRLTYAPTVHMYRSMSAADPAVTEGLEQIDRAIDEALARFAAALPCDHVPAGGRAPE